ncbi:MAG: RdgB/HAM1 family non-canonical purine NTP pyrophosphatase [Actinobacteria bacterium]|nr:RdgB/HAM1 family non-canonical purine NTP pyrophosphatase [Actinomycetota bacterium]MCL5447443.1 RdgB/HAM1 family non-canonical purine NTP pyrophosphatase [Actinomycetota bacterium]
MRDSVSRIDDAGVDAGVDCRGHAGVETGTAAFAEEMSCQYRRNGSIGRQDAAQREAVLATANPDKVREIRSILSESGWRLLDRPASINEIDETGSTIEENALLKARTVGMLAGAAAIADDTGLEVDALGGRPGVYSSRYAGPDASYYDNVVALLKEMDAAGAVDMATRTARFVTVACLWVPDGGPIMATGTAEGIIAGGPRGDGWGYDPIFVPLEGDGRTFAEMEPGEKNAISHRGRAFEELARKISGHWESH